MAVTTTAFETDVVPANPNRLTILFSSESSMQSFLVLAKGMGDVPARFIIPSTGYMEFTYSRHGPLPGAAWTATASMAGLTFYVTEILRNIGEHG